MKVLRALMLLLAPALAFGQRVPASLSEVPAPCDLRSLPPDVQTRLKGELRSWKVQGPADLGSRAHERWESEKPLACPGIAVGQFESAKASSYAVLLVLRAHTDGGYKFLIFSPNAGRSSYEMKVIDSGDHGATNFFIHAVRISKLFDEQSRRTFQVQTSEGTLLADAAEKEYETDVYFWSRGSYQHSPVDY